MKYFRAPARRPRAMRPFTASSPAGCSSVRSTGVERLESRLLFVAGELDFTFSADGKQFTDFGNTDTARAVAIQPDGRIVVAGDWDGGLADFAIARFLPGGALDPTFAGDGRANLTFGAGTFGGVERATSVALQSDGKIIVAGYTDAGTAGGGAPFDFAVARLNPDGSLDTTFSGDGKQTINFGNDDRAHAVAIQPDGKIVLVGQWDGGLSDFAIVRLNADGALDTTFSSDGKQNLTFGAGLFGGVERANAVALTPSGDIVVAGYTDAGGVGGNSNNFAVARLNSDGSLDAFFDGDGKQTIDFGFNDQATAVAIDRLGRVILAGFDDGGAADFAVARLTSSGALDTSFNNIAVPSSYNGDGRLSFTFGTGTFGGVERARAIALEPNGLQQEIYVSGFTDAGGGTADNFAIARIRPDGTLDSSFGGGDGRQITDLGADDEAYGMALQSDGKAVVVGASAGNFAVVRYLAELDPAFGFDGRQTTDFGYTDEARGVAVQSDGKIVAVGYDDGGLADFAVARYLPNGSLDTSFNDLAAPTGWNGDGKLSFTFGAGTFGGVERATSVALQSDGKIVVAGYTNTSGTGTNFDFAVARLNPNGTLDTTFSGDGKQTINFGSDDRAHAVAIQPDGKIVLVGQWDGGASDFAIARLNADGALDTTFSGDGKQNLTFGAGTFGGVERANAVALAPDGDIWVAGYTDAGGTAGNPNNFAVARLNSNGALDAAFSGDGKFTIDFNDDDQATGIAIRPDGRVVVGGFSNDGSGDFAVAQIRGSDLDVLFGGGDGQLELLTNDLTEFATGLALLENGKIVMVGYSNSGTSSPNNFVVARVLADGSGADPSFNADGEHQLDFGADDKAFAVAVQPDGKVVVAGTSGGNFAVARYDSAPTVTRVYVSGSNWTPLFKNYLSGNGLGSATYGYAVPAGPGQLATLPWIGINEINITFSENVTVAADDLRIFGVNTPEVALNPASFAYAAGTRTATWRLPAGQFLRADRFRLSLDADADGVKTSLGAALDGDWRSGFFERFPSGDGAAGGDFLFAINVLPGDADRAANQRVATSDVNFVKARLNRSADEGAPPAGFQPYTIMADVDGNGRIATVDINGVKARLNTVLPPPPAPLTASASLFGTTPIRDGSSIADAVLV